jgi:hypothetical protein
VLSVKGNGVLERKAEDKDEGDRHLNRDLEMI